jgi:hypothetical protein
LKYRDSEIESAGTIAAAQGTRASANTSGPDFTWAEDAGEIADPKIRTNEESLFLLPDRHWESEPFQTAIRPLT